MNHQTTIFKNTQFPFLPRLYYSNPIHTRLLFPSVFFSLHPNNTKSFHSATFSCRGLHSSLLSHPSRSLHFFDVNKPASTVVKTVDIATLGNLCVDIVLNIPKLPMPSPEARKVFMKHLSSSPSDKRYWKVGENCNMAIAAARLGLKCITIDHVGNEIYEKFFLDVLRDEGIGMIGMCEETDVINASSSYETLLCWVLVDPMQKHGFLTQLSHTFFFN